MPSEPPEAGKGEGKAGGADLTSLGSLQQEEVSGQMQGVAKTPRPRPSAEQFSQLWLVASLQKRVGVRRRGEMGPGPALWALAGGCEQDGELKFTRGQGGARAWAAEAGLIRG